MREGTQFSNFREEIHVAYTRTENMCCSRAKLLGGQQGGFTETGVGWVWEGEYLSQSDIMQIIYVFLSMVNIQYIFKVYCRD